MGHLLVINGALNPVPLDIDNTNVKTGQFFESHITQHNAMIVTAGGSIGDLDDHRLASVSNLDALSTSLRNAMFADGHNVAVQATGVVSTSTSIRAPVVVPRSLGMVVTGAVQDALVMGMVVTGLHLAQGLLVNGVGDKETQEGYQEERFHSNHSVVWRWFSGD